MYSSNVFAFLAIALAAVSATSPDQNGFIEKRQIGSIVSGVLPDTTTSSSSTDTSITSPTSVTSTSSSSSISSTSSETSTSTSSSSSSLETSTSSSTSSSSSSSSQTPIVTSTPRSTVIVTMTSGGSTFASTSTDFSLTTSTPTGMANADGSSGGSSGLDPATRNKIIGATVGVGGAIILAGLAFAAWKLWGKKKAEHDEDEILMAGSSAHGEKLTHSSSSNNPFKSNLEQYHAHSGTNF